jgi:alpha-ketoglutarate-dependent taurine dioxygenase
MAETAFPNAKDPQSPLDIVPVTGRIGAEIRGVQIGDKLDDSTIAAIRAALVRHKVLFFRDQKDLSDEAHESFAWRFGAPDGTWDRLQESHPNLPVSARSRRHTAPSRCYRPSNLPPPDQRQLCSLPRLASQQRCRLQTPLLCP